MNGEPLPPHHRPDGGFRNPWPTDTRSERGRAAFLKWQWQRLRRPLPSKPPAAALPRVEPRIAHPRAAADEMRVTWAGHATFLIQLGGLNVLTDPHWSRRASPFRWAGPARFVPAAIDWELLPPIDAVVLSHDHYDHLDEPTVRRLHERFGEGIQWFVPLGYAEWFAERGILRVAELDWWGTKTLQTSDGELRVRALPAQHWTSRSPLHQGERLWASWALSTETGAQVHFTGDTGYFPGFREIGERAGPCDVALLPIGAYEPRWFMRPVHMNPEEAVAAYRDLGCRGELIPLHWGTFRLTDEDPLEPPARLQRRWSEAGLPPERLRILRHGETFVR